MGIAFLYYTAFLIFGFIAMYCAFSAQTKLFEKKGKMAFSMQPILYIFFLNCLGAIGAYFLTDNKDFITTTNLFRLVLPLICAVVIYSVSWFLGGKAEAISVVLSVALCVLMQSPEGKFVPFGLNEYVFKFLVIVFFSVFCLGYKVLNVLPHTIVIISATMLLGVSLLSGIGGAPVYLALVSSMLLGALTAYMGVNLNRVKIEFDEKSCTILAFLICNIFMLDMGELSFSSCVIFTMVFWAELAVALYNKFFVNKSGSLVENSHFYAAAQELTLSTLMSNVFKLGLITTFFGWFQLFSINQYSLPIVTFFVILWLNTSMGANLMQPPKSLKEINLEFVADIKKNLKETKETISQITNKKD